MKVVYHPQAEAEVIEAARYYSDRLADLGSDFLDAIDSAVKSILADPFRLPVVEANVRRCLVKRFPYGVYYRIEGDTIRILVVRHHSRHPDYGKDRQ